MRGTILLIMIAVIIVLTSGYGIMRAVLVNTVNARMDSSEATMINEIDSKIYKDFHSPTAPTNIEYSDNSFQYSTEKDIVSISNEGDKMSLQIEYRNGDSWESKMKGNIEVQKVESVKIGEDIKVDLSTTNSEIYALTYNFVTRDKDSKRVSINRSFTRYLTIIPE